MRKDLNMEHFQYQTFPDAEGMVDSEAKLLAFNIPDLNGKSFLDIGCNEGYYCGYAKERGAKKVVGIDGSEAFIKKAQSRFPDLNFLHQDWHNLPEIEFDVILYCSTMHYLRDEDETIRMLSNIRKHLTPNGVLIIECGINPAQEDWLEITRGDLSKVRYPSIEKLEDLMVRCSLVHRMVGYSESGDGIKRIVFHCRKFCTPINLVVGSSDIGKTRFSYSTTNYDLERIISVDMASIELVKEKFNVSIEDIYKFNAIDWLKEHNPDNFSSIISSNLIDLVNKKIKEFEGTPRKNASILIDGLSLENKDHEEIIASLGKYYSAKNPFWITQKRID